MEHYQNIDAALYLCTHTSNHSTDCLHFTPPYGREILTEAIKLQRITLEYSIGLLLNQSRVCGCRGNSIYRYLCTKTMYLGHG